MSSLPAAPPAGPTLAARLEKSHVGIRPDLLISRLTFQGQPAYVLQDPLTHATFRLAAADYRLFTLLDSRRSLGEIFASLVEEGLAGAEEEEEFYRFVLTLHRNNFLHLPLSNEKALYQRHTAIREARRRRAWMSLIFFRCSLFNPTRFLDRTEFIARLLFHRFTFALWCAVVAAGLLITYKNRGEISRPFQQVLLMQNLPLLWASLVILKVVHELGHAFACKRFGGTVPEIGVNFIVFTPLPYVDATASWRFPSKLHRIIVCLAGMYVELFFASVGILVWSVTPPSLLNAVAYNVALLAGVVTLVFNLNPLMKFDGYYAMSDLIEVPNLRQRAVEYVKYLFQRLLLSAPKQECAEGPWTRVVLAIYGVSASVYKFVLVMGISAAIATKFFLGGLLLAGSYVLSELFRAVRGAVELFFRSPETAHVRLRARVLGSLLMVGLPVGACLLPIASRVVAPAMLSSTDEVLVRSEVSAFITAAHADEAAVVPQGAVLVDLEHSDPRMDLLEAEGRVEQARYRAASLEYSDPAAAQRERQRVAYLTQHLDWQRTRDLRREVTAPRGGQIVMGLDARDVGRFVEAGEPLVRIRSGAPVVRALVTESDLEVIRPEPGDALRFRTFAAPDRVLRATLQEVRPIAMQRIRDVGLTHVGGGDIPVHPSTGEPLVPHFEMLLRIEEERTDGIPYGATGVVLLEAPARTLGFLGRRMLLRFLQRIQQND